VGLDLACIPLLGHMTVLAGVQREQEPKMTAQALEHLLGKEFHTPGTPSLCVPDPNGGWDYICTRSPGYDALYDVGRTRILKTLVIVNNAELEGRAHSGKSG